MKKLTAAAVALCAFATTPAPAADLFGSAQPERSEPAPLTEVGSNWYIRGDIGLGLESAPTVTTAGLIPTITTSAAGGVGSYNVVGQPPGDPVHSGGFTLGNNQNLQNAYFEVGVGYQLNNWIRLEATYGFRHGAGQASSSPTLCQETMNSVTNAGAAAPAGFLWSPVACNGYINSSIYNNLVMGSIYFDLGHYWGVTPYVGAGAGMNATTTSGSTSFYDSNGPVSSIGGAAAGGTPPTWVVWNGAQYVALNNQPGVVFGKTNWNRTFGGTKFAMAGSLMAGFGYKLTPSATLDVGYKLLDANVMGGNARDFAQQLHIGIRYMAD